MPRARFTVSLLCLLAACRHSHDDAHDNEDAGDAAVVVEDASVERADAARAALQIVSTASTLTVGTTTQLNARAIRDGAPIALATGLAWQSADETIAAIDATGLVHAIAPGTVQLVVRWSGLTSTPLTLVVVAASAYATPPTVSTHVPTSWGHRTWAHYNFQGLPDYIYSTAYPATGSPTYRELYPIFSRYGYPTPPPSYDTNTWSYIAGAGLTGVFLYQTASDTKGPAGENGDLSGWMAEVEASGEPVEIGLAITPDDNNSAELVESIERYCDCAAGKTGCASPTAHPSAAKLDGRYIISLYAADRLTTTATAGQRPWQAVRNKLVQDGYAVFLIGDFSSGGLTAAKIDTTTLLDFDALYDFGYPTLDGFYAFVALANTLGKPFIGGQNAGYDRETTAGGYIPFSATLYLRQLWQAALAVQQEWNQLETWADTQENTQLEPSSEWSFTRGDINHWFSVKLGSQARTSTDTQARLYITTPTHVHLDQAAPAEALVLNWSQSPVTVTLQLVDGNGTLVGNQATTTIAAGAQDAATLNIDFDELTPQRFVRALATSVDAQGNVIEQVTSAPILVYDRFEAPDLRVLFYSIPAARALAGPVGIALHGNPITDSDATASVALPSGVTAPRFVEVLQNTREACDPFLQLASNICAVPLQYATQPEYFSSPFATYNSYRAEGFYVARVVDAQGNVGYSDPVYVPLPSFTGGYRLIDKNSLLAMDDKAQSLVQDSTGQTWALAATAGTDDPPGLSTISNGTNGISVVPSDAGTASVDVSTTSGMAAQWSLRYFDQWGYDGTYYLILNRATGQALSIAGHSQQANAAVVAGPVNVAWGDANNDDNNNDKWRIEPVVSDVNDAGL